MFYIRLLKGFVTFFLQASYSLLSLWVWRCSSRLTSLWAQWAEGTWNTKSAFWIVCVFVLYWSIPVNCKHTAGVAFGVLANNQLDALLHVFIYFISLRVSSITVLIIRRSNYINTLSGMISLCKWLLGMPVRRELLTGIPSSHTD